MARAATTSDAFNAVAEPRRREILTLLVVQERPVGDIVAALRIDQPSVSKHLRVLRDVGLGACALQRTPQVVYGPTQRPYGHCTNGLQIFERYWRHQLNRVKERAEAESATESRQNSRNPRRNHDFHGTRALKSDAERHPGNSRERIARRHIRSAARSRSGRATRRRMARRCR